MELIDFNNIPKNIRRYGGNAGNKFGIKWKQENWMIKFPKNTRNFKSPKVSYTTSPLSEYLGSKIYESLGLPVHEVVLGYRKSENSSQNKIVVACKDFLPEAWHLVEFKDIKNAQFYADGSEGTGGSGTNLSEVLETIERSEDFMSFRDEAKERFWDMFVIDFVIGNNDRNNTNWGILTDAERVRGLSPIYDNGNSFYNKRAKEQFDLRIDDEMGIDEDVYSIVSVYLLDDGHHIRPSELIASGAYEGCNQAVKRFMQNYDFGKIKAIFDEVPDFANEMAILPQSQKDYLLKVIHKRVTEVLLPSLQN